MQSATLPLVGLTPPNPANVAKCSLRHGQRLLTQLRSLERSDDQQLMEDFGICLVDLSAQVYRGGVLQGDLEQAEQILAAIADIPTAGSKRQRSQAGLPTGDQTEGDSGAATQEVHFILSAFCRILDSSSRKSSVYNECWDILVKCACDCLLSWTSFVASQSSVDSLVLAEYELLASNGKQVLSLVCNNAGTALLERIPMREGLRCPALESQQQLVSAVVACLRVASALLNLFGTKLSRNMQLIKEIRDFALKALDIKDEKVMAAAALLVASVPCAGGLAPGATPANEWEDLTNDCIGAITILVKVVAVPPKKSKETPDGTPNGSPLTQYVRSQVERIQSEQTERGKTNIFLHVISSMSNILCQLIKRPPVLTGSVISTINAAAFLRLVETMVAVPVSAENIYFATKKRLRLEAVGDNTFSPSAAVHHVANPLKYHGLMLFRNFMESIGGASLAPVSVRIQKLIASSLSNSMSSAVLGVIDPAAAGLHPSDKKRWLHNSVVLRRQAVDTVRDYLLTFGAEFPSIESSRRTTSWIEQVIYLIGAVVVEELTVANLSVSQYWGGFRERTELLVAALHCLEAALSLGGEYMPINLRHFLDSVTKRALMSLANPDSTASTEDFKSATLSLAISCVLTSWPDGSLSWLVLDLASTARQAQQSSAISSIVTRALAVCDAVLSPRIPAIVTRAVDRKPELDRRNQEISVLSIEEAVQNSLVGDKDEAVVDSEPLRPKSNKAIKEEPTAQKRSEAKKRPIHEISSKAETTTSSPHLIQKAAEQRLETKKIGQVDDEEEDFALPDIVDIGPDEGDADDE